MRSGTDRAKLLEFIRLVGASAEGPGRVYLVGGSTALLLGIRDQTIDIDIKLDPEPKAIFENIAILKERLNVNVELASPDQFLPPLPGWQTRSEFITKSGLVEFYHYDFYAQALSKILRGHANDLADVKALVSRGKVVPSKLAELFHEIRSGLVRYPGIDADEFKARVSSFIEEESTRND